MQQRARYPVYGCVRYCSMDNPIVIHYDLPFGTIGIDRLNGRPRRLTKGRADATYDEGEIRLRIVSVTAHNQGAFLVRR